MTNTEPFSELPEPIARALVRRGFAELTPVQRAVVEAEHDGRDLRISSQTGSGKTVAIGLALAAHFLERPVASASGEGSGRAEREPGVPPSAPSASAARPRALVIVPTRELAAQVREELNWLFAELPGATVEVVTGGTSVMRERIALARRPAFVVGTPGRLLDHMRNGALACLALEHVILDEADQMLDMGFKDELDAIREQLPEKRQTHLVSATFPQAVKALADRFQTGALTLEGTKLGLANPDIEHIAYTIRRHETYAALVNVLLLAGDSRCLLFVNRRVDATELAERLAADGFGAAPFSGELPQAQRTRTLAAFRNGILPILVSTDVAARGIDVPEISTVIHVDPPRNPDAYVHRSGRTGRAGRAGRSILLIEGTESRRVSRMLAATRIAVAWQRVPARSEVERVLDQQAKKLLFTRLDEASPNESERLAAKQLLTERDPIELVAVLFDLAKPKPPHAPMEVVGLDPYVDDRPGRNRPTRGSARGPMRDEGRPGDSRGPRGRGRTGAERGHEPHAARGSKGAFKARDSGPGGRTARVERGPRPVTDRGPVGPRSQRAERPDRPDRPERRERSERPERRERAGPPERRERPERPVRPARDERRGPSTGKRAAEALERHWSPKKPFKARRVANADQAAEHRPAGPHAPRSARPSRPHGPAAARERSAGDEPRPRTQIFRKQRPSGPAGAAASKRAPGRPHSPERPPRGPKKGPRKPRPGAPAPRERR